MVIYGIKKELPDLIYFKDDYKGKYPDKAPVTNEDLERIYPKISTEAKENEDIMEEVRKITAMLDKGHKGYNALWNQIQI